VQEFPPDNVLPRLVQYYSRYRKSWNSMVKLCSYQTRFIYGGQCCQPCVIPANLGMFFCGIAGFLEDLPAACFRACFIWKLLVFGFDFCRFRFCGLLFLNLWHFFCFHVLQNAIWACFCVNFLILGLFFRICLPVVVLSVPAGFLICSIFLPNPFWSCFADSLVCFCKIIWHHWWRAYQLCRS